MGTDPGNTVNESLTDTWLWKIGTEAAQIIVWEYINGILVSVYCTGKEDKKDQAFLRWYDSAPRPSPPPSPSPNCLSFSVLRVPSPAYRRERGGRTWSRIIRPQESRAPINRLILSVYRYVLVYLTIAKHLFIYLFQTDLEEIATGRWPDWSNTRSIGG